MWVEVVRRANADTDAVTLLATVVDVLSFSSSETLSEIGEFSFEIAESDFARDWLYAQQHVIVKDFVSGNETELAAGVVTGLEIGQNGGTKTLVVRCDDLLVELRDLRVRDLALFSTTAPRTHAPNGQYYPDNSIAHLYAIEHNNDGDVAYTEYSTNSSITYAVRMRDDWEIGDGWIFFARRPFHAVYLNIGTGNYQAGFSLRVEVYAQGGWQHVTHTDGTRQITNNPSSPTLNRSGWIEFDIQPDEPFYTDATTFKLNLNDDSTTRPIESDTRSSDSGSGDNSAEGYAVRITVYDLPGYTWPDPDNKTAIVQITHCWARFAINQTADDIADVMASATRRGVAWQPDGNFETSTSFGTLARIGTDSNYMQQLVEMGSRNNDAFRRGAGRRIQWLAAGSYSTPIVVGVGGNIQPGTNWATVDSGIILTAADPCATLLTERVAPILQIERVTDDSELVTRLFAYSADWDMSAAGESFDAYLPDGYSHTEDRLAIQLGSLIHSSRVPRERRVDFPAVEWVIDTDPTVSQAALQAKRLAALAVSYLAIYGESLVYYNIETGILPRPLRVGDTVRLVYFGLDTDHKQIDVNTDLIVQQIDRSRDANGWRHSLRLADTIRRPSTDALYQMAQANERTMPWVNYHW